MDSILCDELIQQIFLRLPPASTAAVSLVSKRWLRLLRASQTSLSLHFTPQNTTIPFPPSFLSHFPYLSFLTITSATANDDEVDDYNTGFSDRLLHSIAASCRYLKLLRFCSVTVTPSSLIHLSSSLSHLSSLSISIARPFSFHWLLYFTSLTHLSVSFTGIGDSDFTKNFNPELHISSLSNLSSLSSLSLSGIQKGDYALAFLWRNCKNIKKLKLQRCESIGNRSSLSSFLMSSSNLQEVTLTTCRNIIVNVLSNLTLYCKSLNSLSIHDGGNAESLLQFIVQNRSNIQSLDIRLPLDFGDNHLLAIAQNLNKLSTFRLQNSSLVTDEGLRTLSSALGNVIEELSLINCDAVEKHTGLLAALGQKLRKLRRLNLSYNGNLVDKEFVSMIVSCHDLRELKLKGCSKLSNEALVSVLRICKDLESVNITRCCGIDKDGIKKFVMNCSRLKRVQVEDEKLTDLLKVFASINGIKVGC